MGFDVDCFVDKSISSSLICPICCCVVENPVVTPQEHLYCEACLLSWLTTSTKCPMTQLDLDATTIKKPSRLVMCILGDLRRYCTNKGCTWQGTCDLYTAHSKTCNMRSREVLLADLQVLEAANASLAKKYEQTNVRLNKLQLANKELSHELAMSTAKLRVYDAFFSTNNNILRPDVDASLSNAYDNINEFYRLRGDHDDEEEEEDDEEDQYDEEDYEREYLEGDDGDDTATMYPILAEFALSSRLRMDDGKPSQRHYDEENDDGCGQKSADNDVKGMGGGQESTWTEINRLRSLNSFQLAVTGTTSSNRK